MNAPAGRVTRTREDAIGWIALDNPARRNAVSLAMWQGLLDAVRAFEADDDVRVIVLRGAGEAAFASGADISEFEDKRSGDARQAYDEVAARATAALTDVGKPTIAMVHGWCVGGGLALALACDVRYASDAARFAIPAARLGLGYSFDGVRKLVDTVGPAFAREIFYTARPFGADDALRMGLVNRVLPAAGLEAFVREDAGRIADNAPLTVASIKTLVGQALLDESARDEALCQAVVDRCFASEDYKEGRRAFMDKRRPVFRGK